jgi:hypothetical protein
MERLGKLIRLLKYMDLLQRLFWLICLLEAWVEGGRRLVVLESDAAK